MHGWGLFFFLLFLLVVFAAAGWVVYVQLRARRHGLPSPTWRSYIPFMASSASGNYPTPRSSGPLEWVRDQFDRLRNKRTARGAYEETSGYEGAYGGSSRGGATTGGGRGRGRGGLEDDAWDTRVGNEDPYGAGGGYGYEEQELGLTPTPGLHNEPYGGGATSAGGDYLTSGRGRVGARIDHHGHDPFGDQHEAPSLRSVSPRPEGDARGHTKGTSSLDNTSDGGGGSPTSTRKSAFREGI